MDRLRFALFGTGFWSRFQLAGWNETGGAECVALYNRTPAKAHELARSMGLNVRIYGDASELLRAEKLDFADIVTSPESHCALVALAAASGTSAVCQKPMAPSLPEAEEMVRVCRQAGVSLFINENWRWQEPIRQLKGILDEGEIGAPYRARIRMASGFPVFENQPALRTLEHFLIADIGSHILDTARFLFGEPQSVYCVTDRVQPDIKGEDVATVVLKYAATTVVCEMGYTGAPLEEEHFPQTLAFIEGRLGSIELAPDYRLRVTTRHGTKTFLAKPPYFPWSDPAYEVVHASIVPCQANILGGLRGELLPETTGEDNLLTMRLVHYAYESAKRNETIRL